jgi:hypothetical protein
LITDEDPSGIVSDPGLQDKLNHWISQKNRNIPEVSNEQQLYFVIPQQGISMTDNIGRSSCASWCGYHWQSKSASQKNLFYAVVPVGCSDCPAGLNTIDTITYNISHELAEAITDPLWNLGTQTPQPRGWSINIGQAFDEYIEIADKCAGEWEYALDNETGQYFAVQKLWSRSRGECFAAMWTGITLPYTVVDAPSIVGINDVLAVCWTDPQLRINVIDNYAKGGFSFSQPVRLQDYQNPNPEYARDSPSLSIGPGQKMFLAWTGIDAHGPSYHRDNAGSLNLMSSFDFRNWTSKVMLSERSSYGPALAYGGGYLFLAWVGPDNRINVRRSADGKTWYNQDKIVLQQWSIDSPSMTYIYPNLYLLFRSSNGNNKIFIAKSSDLGRSFPTVFAIPNERAASKPALTKSGNDLILAWWGSDSSHTISTLRADSNSKDTITQFGRKRVYSERADGGLSLTNFSDEPFMAWADSNNKLNIMPLVFQ